MWLPLGLFMVAYSARKMLNEDQKINNKELARDIALALTSRSASKVLKR
jgi:hypothetical protein